MEHLVRLDTIKLFQDSFFKRKNVEGERFCGFHGIFPVYFPPSMEVNSDRKS